MNPYPRTEAEIAAMREYWDGRERRVNEDSIRLFQSQPMLPDKPRGGFFGLKYALPAAVVIWTAIALFAGWAMRGPIR